MAKREAQLRAAVLRDFDDEAARAVYADWLQERGDPRGELISLEIKWAAGQRDEGETKRIHELRRALVSEVKRRRGYPAMSLDVAGGFVVAIDAQLHWVLERGAELFAEEPVRYLLLRGARPAELERIGEVPGIERVRWLWLSSATPKVLAAFPLTSIGLRLTPRIGELPALLDLPQAHLVRGFMPWSGFSVESLAAAAAAEPALQRIEWLALAEDALVAGELLATLPWQLRHLDLSQRSLSHDALRAIAGNAALSALARLDLSGSDLDDEGAHLLAAAPWPLAHLDVSDCNKLTPAALDVLRQRFGARSVVTDFGMLPQTL